MQWGKYEQIRTKRKRSFVHVNDMKNIREKFHDYGSFRHNKKGDRSGSRHGIRKSLFPRRENKKPHF